MVDTSYDATTDRWLCPDDRQLALRGRLETGWSTIPDTGYRKGHSVCFTEQEKMIIEEVLQRAAELEMAEQMRIGMLMNNVEQTKNSLHGNGETNCLVCGYKAGFLREMLRRCSNCKRMVCNKCSVETAERSMCGEVEKCYYCVVCFEERELWKRSGAWFFKMLPKFIMPGEYTGLSPTPKKNFCSVGSVESEQLYDSEIQSDYVDGRQYSVDSDDSDNEHFCNRGYNSSGFQHYGSYNSGEEDTASRKSSSSGSKLAIGQPERVGNRRRVLLGISPPLSEDEDEVDGAVSDMVSIGNEKTKSVDDLSAANFRKISSKSMDSLHSLSSQVKEEQKKPHLSNIGKVPGDSLANGDAQEGKGTFNVNATPDQQKSIPRKGTIERKEYYGSLGMIEWEMQYNENDKTLLVSIKSARGLKAMDHGGTSDPYVKMYIWPGHTKSTKHKTKVHYKTLDPDFNEDFTYHGITERDLKQKMIRLVVMDENRLSSNAFIGETYVSLDGLITRSNRRFKRLLDPYTVHDAGGKGDDYRGKIQVSLQYVSKKNKLIVGIERCVDLKPMDPNGYSDPYVKIYLSPDKKKSSKKKTRVIKKDLNPLYHEEFSYELPINILASKTLQITVWDHDVGSSNDFIGSVSLGNGSREDALKHWFETLKYPDQKKTYWHVLSPELPTDMD